MLTVEEKQKFRNRPLNEIARCLFGIDSSFPPVTPRLACVYALEMSDNTVKIGVTTKLENRIKEVAGAVYLDILRVHNTDFAPRDFMYKIESRCHAAFADKRVRGEFFDITFDEACAELDRHAEEIAAAFKSADEKFLDEVEYFAELKAEGSAEEGEYAFDFTDENLDILCEKCEAHIQKLKTVIKLATNLKAERERNAILQPKADYCDAVLNSEELLDITDIASDYGFTGDTFNQMLADFQVQYRNVDTWELQQRYSGKGYAQLNSNGELAWTQRGRYFLYNFLKEHGILPVHERLQLRGA